MRLSHSCKIFYAVSPMICPNYHLLLLNKWFTTYDKFYWHRRAEWVVSTNLTRFPHPNSGIALAVYDLVRSFPVELKAIWNRKFWIGALLYLSIRYGTIISMLFEVLQSLLLAEITLGPHLDEGKLSFLPAKLLIISGSCKQRSDLCSKVEQTMK